MPQPRSPVVSMLLAAALATGACQQGEGGYTSASTVSASNASAAEADRAWRAALANFEAAALSGLLDEDFEWTDVRGRIRNAADTVASEASLREALQNETDVEFFDYGDLGVITSATPAARMMRVWVRRPAGWRAFALIETETAAGTTPFAAAAEAAPGDCDNPCRTMPYTPATENARTIAATFQQLKMDEWRPNPERWAQYVLDDVYYVTATARLSKGDRMARLTQLARTGAPSVPGDPVESMRIVEFGEAAVMLARHHPYRGGKPYYSVRVWAVRDGRWQLANTQQTVIAEAEAVGPA